MKKLVKNKQKENNINKNCYGLNKYVQCPPKYVKFLSLSTCECDLWYDNRVFADAISLDEFILL